MSASQNVSPDTSPTTAGTVECPPLPEDALIIIPVRGTVLFPGTLMPLTLGRKRSIAAAQEAMRAKRPVGLILQREAVMEDPAPSDVIGHLRQC